MRKYILLIILLIILSTGWGPLGCEGEISGRVIDSQGRAVNKATIVLYIRSFELVKTETDNAGWFKFENVIWGNYEIKATKEGYVDSHEQVTLGESYACKMEMTDIVLMYDNESKIMAVYDGFIEGIKGSAVNLDDVLGDGFEMTFTGNDEVICTKENFCQNCPIPEGVEFSYSNISIADNTATVDVTFIIEGISETEWSSGLKLSVDNISAVPSWEIISWDMDLHDFKPATEAGKGWADPDGYIEFDSETGKHRWKCIW